MAPKKKLTQASIDLGDEIAERLAPLGEVTCRKMFGGIGIFESKLMFAMITSDGGIYFKVDDSNRAQFEKAGSQQFRSMPYMELPAKVLNNTRSLRKWAGDSLAVARAAKK